MKNNNDYYEENEGYNIENSIDASIPFAFPTDEPINERHFDTTNIDVIIRFATLLFASPKPKMTLAALLYSCGIDVGIYLNCKNTETEISENLGESKQNFSAAVKRIKADFGIKHHNTGKKHSSKDVYKNTNYRKTKQDYEQEEE